MGVVRRAIDRVYGGALAGLVRTRFLADLIDHTQNFGRTHWVGHPIWQNVLDLWTIQETLAEIRPALLIEAGTFKGGSALFFAHLFDLLGYGEVVTVDIQKVTDWPAHPRITYLIGSTLDEQVLEPIRHRAREAKGPVMVILDDDHAAAHVHQELEVYCRFVTPGSFLLVQDGVIDILPMLKKARPGPLRAIQRFVTQHPEFEVDQERCSRFLVTHHPMGWLRKLDS